MDNQRLNIIISIALILGLCGYMAIKVQDRHIPPEKPKGQVAKKEPPPLDPVAKWAVVRQERAHDLDEARKKGMPHSKIILQKCNCPHLTFHEMLYKPNTPEKALAKWRYMECKTACKNTDKVTATEQKEAKSNPAPNRP